MSNVLAIIVGLLLVAMGVWALISVARKTVSEKNLEVERNRFSHVHFEDDDEDARR